MTGGRSRGIDAVARIVREGAPGRGAGGLTEPTVRAQDRSRRSRWMPHIWSTRYSWASRESYKDTGVGESGPKCRPRPPVASSYTALSAGTCTITVTAAAN